MSELTLDQNQLKAIVKVALLELFQENRSAFTELIAEAIEEIGLERAIVEGEATEPASRADIFKLLE
ncbi:MAG TPA: hypothetical protein V6C84_16370 [Coleofasciculaceae cyanobacterium]|jgi:hypothetical protein